MNNAPTSSSPHWGWTTKLIVGLTLVAVGGWLIIKFQNFIGPLLLVFIVAYIFYPLAKQITKWLKIPWRLAVSLIYLIVIVVLGGLLTLGGLALVNQMLSLINFLQTQLLNLPTFIQGLPTKILNIGPFQIALAQVDINAISNQVFSFAQSLLGQIGGILGLIASSAATLVGWIAFILLVSYFILVESAGIPTSVIKIHIPGYDADIKRLGTELSRIWNSFLRGQLIIIAMAFVAYSVLLGAFRLPFYMGLAVIACIGRFIPYIGPLIMWTTYGLVSYFAGTPPFGLSPFFFAVLVVGLAIVLDSIFDNLVSPRVMSQALKVHPAAVLIAALIGATLLGLIGILLAAPVLATMKLFVTYIYRKMIDLDPWEGMNLRPSPPPSPIIPRLKAIYGFIARRVRTDWPVLVARVRKLVKENRRT